MVGNCPIHSPPSLPPPYHHLIKKKIKTLYFIISLRVEKYQDKYAERDL